MPSPLKRRAQAAASSPRSAKKVKSIKIERTEVLVETQEDLISPPKRAQRARVASKKDSIGSNLIDSLARELDTSAPSKIGESITDDIATVEKAESFTTPKRSRKSRTSLEVLNIELKEELGSDEEKPAKRSKAKTKIVTKTETTIVGEVVEGKVKRHRKTKEEKEAANMPLALRTPGLRVFIGAHVSCAKGVQNSVTNAVHVGGNSFALFLKSQRKWENPPLQDDHMTQFQALCKEHKFESKKHVLPHGSYLVNLAQEDPTKAKQAYDTFLDDLHRCEALGITLYNFHPGNTNSNPRPEAISRIAKALNRAHKATKTVKPVLENMAGTGNVIGSTFEDLRDIIEQVEDKTRIGVCIDTCHSFAAGYDLRAPEAFRNTLDNFDKVVGMKYLCALHLNDSKAVFGSHRDLHQNIGLGFLGLRAFHNVMNEPRFEDLPMVLETPIDSKDSNGKVVEDRRVWAREIKLLESLVGMDAESVEFKTLESELAAQGAEERAKFQEQFDRKAEKDLKAAQKGKGKGRGKKGKKNEGSEESCESCAEEA